MSNEHTDVERATLINRVKNLISAPQTEWDRIAGEPADVRQLYMGYALPLLALAAAAAFVGLSLVGIGSHGVTYRETLIEGAIVAVVKVASGLGGLFLMALIVNALAKYFAAEPDIDQAHKLVVYAGTAFYLGGVFALIPSFAMLGALVGLYSFALLFIGLPRLMKVGDDKRVGYFASIVIASLILGVVGYQLGRAAGFGLNRAAFSIGASRSAPAPESVGVSAEAGSLAAAPVARVSPAALQAMLPRELPGGYARLSTSAEEMAGLTRAEGLYERGNAHIKIVLINLPVVADLASAVGVSEAREDAGGSRRVNTVGGRTVHEEISRGGARTEHTVLGRGFAIAAEGEGAGIEATRAAVEAVGIERLEAMR